MYKMVKIEGGTRPYYWDFLGVPGKFYFYDKKRSLCFHSDKSTDILLLDYYYFRKQDNKIVIRTKRENTFTFIKVE
jgi:hypothetical protein